MGELDDPDPEAPIARRLGLARGTVRRIARTDTAEELLVHNRTGRWPILLEEFKPYLRRRWNEGCTNVTHLFTEIRARGYRGGIKTVDYLFPFTLTAKQNSSTRVRPAPSPEGLVSWRR